ncbi:MAG: hypothetical protein FWF29_02405 [Treponema sp.]|nr:hypothetical protein [Treponema sp.]
MEETNPFVGTWEAYSGYHEIFTNKNVTVYDTDNNIYWTATYTYDDKNITVKINTELSHPDIIESWGNVKLLSYNFESNTVLYVYGVRLEKITL